MVLHKLQRSATEAALNVAKSITTEKTAQYSCAAIVVWTLAILSMSILTIKDSVLLTQQYMSGQSILNQDLIDASKDAIKLPNMTVCVRYYKENSNETSFKNFHNYLNFSKFQLKQAFEFAQRVSYGGYVTKTLRNWEQNHADFDKEVETNESESILLSFKDRQYTFAYTEVNLRAFWNNLASTVCENMNPKFNLVDGARWKKVLDFCKEVGNGNLPLVPVDENTFCFQVPLQLITIQSDEAESNLKDEVSENGSVILGRPILTGKKIIFSFQPLVIRQLLFPEEKMEFLPEAGQHYKLMAFLPETPISYTGVGYEAPIKRWSTKSNQLYREFNFKTSYTRSVWLPMDLTITKKETKLHDLNCVDVYDEASCVIKCEEEAFIDICKCRRFIYRFHTQNSNLNKHPFCTLENYHHCGDRYKEYLLDRQMTDEYNVDQECQKKCSKCSKIKYTTTIDAENVVSSVHPEFIRSIIFKKFFETKLSNENNETFEKKFFRPDRSKEYGQTAMDEYVNEIMKFADKAGGSLKQEYYETLFGRVYFVITVNTNGFYPNVTETLLVTPDGYRSQIGGILGLYLGFSCITAFTMIVSVISYLKKRIQKQKERKKVLSEESSAVASIWRFFGKNKSTGNENRNPAAPVNPAIPAMNNA